MSAGGLARRKVDSGEGECEGVELLGVDGGPISTRELQISEATIGERHLCGIGDGEDGLRETEGELRCDLDGRERHYTTLC